nr:MULTISPECIES: hypothetical protein [Streptomyces]
MITTDRAAFEHLAAGSLAALAEACGGTAERARVRPPTRLPVRPGTYVARLALHALRRAWSWP